MKKILLLVLMFTACFEGFSQEVIKFKKGYVGISLGPSIYVGSDYTRGENLASINPEGGPITYREALPITAGTIGLNLNLIDAGYEIWRGFGINLRWQGGAIIKVNNNENMMISYGGIMAGPMYSYKINEEFTIDLRTRFGRMYHGAFYENEYWNGTNVSSSKREFEYFNFAMDTGLTLRYHFAQKWSWVNNLEYQYFYSGTRHNFDRINLSTGIAFRF